MSNFSPERPQRSGRQSVVNPAAPARLVATSGRKLVIKDPYEGDDTVTFRVTYSGKRNGAEAVPIAPEPRAALEEMRGKFVGERVRRESWIVATLADGATITGNADPGELKRGQFYRFLGQWKDNAKFGRQFVFDGFLEDHTKAGAAPMLVYLKSLSGIGERIARKITDTYGDESLNVLRETPERLADDGIALDETVLAEVRLYLRRSQVMEAAKLELISMIAGRGFPRSTLAAAIEVFGIGAATKIRRNPYLLMQLPGIGFKRADSLYLDLGKPAAAIKRQTRCMVQGMEDDPSGHTWFDIGAAVRGLREKIDDKSKLESATAIELGLRAKVLAKHVDPANGSIWLAPGGRAKAEQTIAKCIASLMEGESHWPPAEALASVSDHQREEYASATVLPVGVLAGSPGTGKTFTLADAIRAVQAADPLALPWPKIVRLVREEGWQPDEVAAWNCRYHPIFVCAPTGKAAVRATETLALNGVADLKARTIHGTLGITPKFGFSFNEARQLPAGYLIVDESSMVDANLLAALLCACPPTMHVLFVGDVGQLAPVGHGAPLRDIIDAGVPTGTLSEIQRNAGTIVRVCAEIKAGKPFRADTTLSLPTANLLHVDRRTPETQIAALKMELARITGDGDDPVKDVQVLVPLNSKGKLCRVELNKILQPLLNPNGLERENCRFRDGDKVICLKNSYLKASAAITDKDFEEDDREQFVRRTESGGEEHYVANGEVGYIVRLDAGSAVVEFSGPTRIVSCRTAGEECVIDLAYAISIHKSQGSEVPIAICMVDASNGGNWIGCRELWYTAISRAKKYCVVIGEAHKINHQCRKISIENRKTFLVEGIKSELSSRLVEADI